MKSTYWKPLDDLADWRQLVGVDNWRVGYSAQCLADAWWNADGDPQIPQKVKTVFQSSSHPLFSSFTPLFLFPEYKVSLPGGSRASQNDLYVLGKANDELVVIMVEGKKEEAFGPTVGEWLSNAPSPGKSERLSFLCTLLHLQQSEISHIRYQLLHRTASAILEAERVGAKFALVLVHSFSPEHRWFDDYAAFLGKLGVTAGIDSISDPIKRRETDIKISFGWVCG